VTLVRTNILEEHIASIIRVKRISEQGTISAVTSDRGDMLPPPTPKCLFLHKPHGVTSQKIAFVTVIADKNLKS
jgi:hypothetical protein